MLDLDIFPRFELCRAELDKLGFSEPAVRSSYIALDQLLDSGWLAGLREPGGSGLFYRHPLVQIVKTGSASGVIEAIELQISISQFLEDPALPEIIRNLKEPNHYANFFFALRCAFAVKRMGWSVQLEPESLHGSKGDFVARTANQEVFFECRNSGVQWAPRVNTGLFEAIFSRQPLHPRSYAIEMVFKTADVPSQSDKVRRELSRLFADFIEKKTESQFEDSAVLLRASWLDARKSHMSMQSMTDHSAWDYVHLYQAEGTKLVILVRIREPEPAGMKRGIENWLDKQMRDKHEQVRAHPPSAASVLLLGLSEDIQSICEERLVGKIRRNHFDALPNLSALAILQRRWNPDSRYRNAVYAYRNNAARQPLSDLHFHALSAALESDYNLADYLR